MEKGRICQSCNQEISRIILERNNAVCPKCGCYMRLHAQKRISMLADKDSFHEWDKGLRWSNPLNDEKYGKKSIELSSIISFN